MIILTLNVVIPVASNILSSTDTNEGNKHFRKSLEKFYLLIRKHISKESLSKLPTQDLAFLLNFFDLSEQGLNAESVSKRS